MKSVRIVVADDHELVRRGVIALLQTRPGWIVVGEAANGREAVDQTIRLKPDVVVLDITMPELNGIEATRRILAAVPGTEVLVLTMHESASLVRRILDAGARGYVSKSDVALRLLEAVEALRTHSAFLTSPAATALVDVWARGTDRKRGRPAPDPLTSREREVLQLLAEGKSSKEIAASLRLSVYTVETHRRNLMQKVDCHSVAQLVRYAICNELVTTT